MTIHIAARKLELCCTSENKPCSNSKIKFTNVNLLLLKPLQQFSDKKLPKIQKQFLPSQDSTKILDRNVHHVHIVMIKRYILECKLLF